MRRDFLFWGIVLILLGVFMFLNAAGIQLPDGLNAMELFWPSLLILLGVWIILSNYWRGTGLERKEISINLDSAQAGSLRLDYGAGRLRLGAGAPTDRFLSGSVSGKIEKQVKFNANMLDVRMDLGPSPVFPFFGGRGTAWDLQLNQDVPLKMHVETGASRSELNLHDLQVTDLQLSTGASRTELILPAAAGDSTVRVELGAASLDMRVPKGVAARIRSEHGLAAIEVDTLRFPFANGMYESADYGTAQNKVDILIQAGAGRVAVH